RKMSRENPCWGALHIHGELLKLGIDIGESSVTKYMLRCRKPPPQTWRILHFNVTAHPTAAWTGQQLREAFPFDQLPRYQPRARDAIFGNHFREQVRDLGINEVLSAPRSPWQRGYIEREIGSIRRECLDHVIVFHENALRRTLNSYFDYYHRAMVTAS